MNRNKRATHEYISFFNPLAETSALHMNISRSLIHEPNQRTTHEYISYFNPLAETSALHVNISRSLIHEPKQARYTWIYLVL